MSAGSEASARRARRNVVLTAAIAGLGGLLFGYDTGIIASALLFIKQDFDLGSFAQGVVVAAVPIGAIAGAAIAGPAADTYGRRLMILLAAGGLHRRRAGQRRGAQGVEVLVIARIVIGVAIGLASAAAPVYISEVAPPESRGRLVSFFQLAVTIGILVAYLVGLAFDDSEGWRWMLGLGCVPALALGFGMLRMPQSPRWLVMSGDDFAARATLAKIRVDDPDTIDRELEEIKESLDDKPGAWSELLQPVVKAALFVGIGLAILQQVTGINTVIYYAPTIVEFTGVNSSAGAILAAVGVGVINVGFTILALRLLDRAGRRTLLMVGVSGMTISLFALGAAFIGGGGSTLASVVAIVSLMTYVASFAISLGPIFWLLNAEIYPLGGAQQGGRPGDDGELDLQLHRLAHLPAADRSGRAQRRLLDLRRHRHRHPLVLLEVRPRDQGQAPRGHPGLLPGPGGATPQDRRRSYPPRDADRRDHRLAAADLLGRVLPAEDGGGDRAALRDRARARPPRARLRLGHLRRRRLDPRRHGRDHHGAEGRPRAGDDGPPQLRRRDHRGAGGDPGPDRGGGDRERLRAARRPAARAKRTSSSPRAGSAAPPSWPPSSPPAGTSRSAAPASPRSTPRRPTSRPTSPT